MDFGLAKRLLSSERATTEEETLTELTRMGTTVAPWPTCRPNSSRAARRSPLRHFLIRRVLFEMLAGVHPFRKEAGMATAAAILEKEPAPLAQYAPGIPERLAKWCR